ncbi:MAG TPA: PSD1 and planctomycete cytochrome C domain-containing protein [Planctomycetaceae bacterium]
MRVGVGVFCVLLCVSASAEGPAVEFERDVLPILKARCFECHDAAKQTAGYRLDVRAVALRGGESGEAGIVPGKSGESELIRRVTSDDEFTVMPPEGERLSEREVAVLKAWIDGGAAWPDALAGDDPRTSDHWAFNPPVRPEPPAVKDEARVRNAIDRFVLARLEAEGLSPSDEADKITLIRRLYLDLIGLPPAPEEIDAFLADESPDAYRNLVDRLLASPHYGERWGRFWLDGARYADSDGYEKDKPRFAYFYRDWVIDALNRDLPYDRFVIEQIAGDLLPNPTQDQLVATGFLRNSMINEEGGVDPEQFRMEAMFDRMDALGKSVLGLTIQCAQCHNHKFDPMTQEEYYGLFAFLNNCHEANIAVYTDEEQKVRDAIFARVREIEADLKSRTPDWPQKMAAWEEAVRGDQPEWRIVRPELDSSGGQKHYLLDDGSILAAGYAPTKHTTEFTVTTDLPEVTAVRLELLNDPNLPRGGPGRSIYGLMALTEFRVVAGPADGSAAPQEVKIASVTADANPAEKPLEPIFDDRSGKTRVTGPASYAIDGKDETAWGIDVGNGRSNVPRKAVFVFEQPIRFEKEAKLTLRLTQNHGGWNSDDNQNNNLGRFRFGVTGAPGATADPLPADVREIVTSVPADRRTPEQTEAVFSYWRTTVPDFAAANAEIESLWQGHPRGTTQLVLQERDERRPTHLLKRGDFLSPVKPLEPHVPAFLHDLPADAPATRLTFAEWLVDRDSPTAARAIVNRVWQQYFGIGIVETSEDLGVQAAEPSHPELLDWLAVEFMDRGWSLKELHRLIVSSATYRQSSRVTPALLARDPYNRLLARGPRLRVEGEVVRDIALAASGLLNPEVGGPSVYPPLPEFLLLPPVSYGPKSWPFSQGADKYRRAMYTFRFRSLPYPVLDTFDSPPGNTSCVRRTRSNTPLQALVSLNEPVFMDCARSLALKTVAEGGSNEQDRLTYAFRRCVGRAPTDAERTELLRLFESQRARFAAGELDPWQLAAADPQNPPALPEGVPPADLAAWTAVSRVLLNLDETITKE